MTTAEAAKIKINAENKIKFILAELMASTGCVVTGISLKIEEGFGLTPSIITDINIKLEIS